MDQTTRTLALRILAKERVDRAERLAEWEEEAERDRREGHTPHYCVHGTNQWVDWDCACWQCEEYGYNGWPDLYPDALGRARSQVRDYKGRLEQALPIVTRSDVSVGMRKGLLDWVHKPLEP